ncbi:MAG: LptF/LptG family permease [Chitinivibrionales bacterium]|nr:LptF/LptG family permease [Chitinivibrionales bacterium]
MILYRHVVKEHIFPFFFSLAILVFIFIMQYAIQILDKIISQGLDAAIVLEIFAINLGWIIALAIPMAILSATLWAFGRMSADNEILAIKASGLNLYHLIAPVIVSASVVCICLIFFNNLILPDANHRTANLMSDISRKRPAAFIEPKVLIKDFENYAIYVKKANGRTGRLEGIKIFSDVPGEDPSTTIADSGEVKQTVDGAYLRLTLYHGETHSISSDNREQHFVGHFDKQVLFINNVDSDLHRTDSRYRGDREKSSQMMLNDIKQNRKKKKGHLAQHSGMIDSTLAVVAFFDSLSAAHPAPSGRQTTSPDSLLSFQHWAKQFTPARGNAMVAQNRTVRESERIIRRIESEKKRIAQYLVEIHKKYAIPFACIIFVLIGAPLGIMARRGGMTVAVSYSIFFFILYWAFLIKGENLADRLVVSPFSAMWSGNILLGACGAFLIIRMVRETTFISWTPLLRWWHKFTEAGEKQNVFFKTVRFVLGLPMKIISLPLIAIRYVIGILPNYIIRLFVGNMVGVFAAIMVVFVVVDYVSNSRRFEGVPVQQTALFYWYYMPWIIQLVFPVVMLLSSMFAMGKLAKNSELIAMKAAGKSIRRVTLPLLFLGLCLVGANFYVSELVLPEANVKRRELLEEIKMQEKAAEGKVYRGRRDFRRNFYYFGNKNTIYCFQEFRTFPQKAKNVWRETFEGNSITQRIHAEKSVYHNNAWSFINGTIRKFQGDSSTMMTFDTLQDNILNATPEEMVVRIKTPEEMSYWELKDYIKKTRRRGEKVLKYNTDLYFKIAYPFMNFIVILLGISVTARIGKGGGALLFGIGLLIVFSYWIIVRFALAFGKSGQLPPLAGAWLGNAIFLLLGILLYRKSDA